ncbi:MAG TPA: hypothetical protein VMH05_08875 [Bryobacteraceae bacterium]|nr:hypothetical protein [Bryobacteraceae bacterium]
MLSVRALWIGMAGAGLVLPFQPAKPVQAQSSSSVSSRTEPDGSQIIEIRNITYELSDPVIPGHPRSDRLLLRKTTHSKETVGDIGVDATVTLEAWRFGDDLRGKPLYTISTSGTDGRTMDNAIFVVSRGLEEVEWWSVYRLGTGQHLFDTYVPLVSFSISKEFLTTRYVGLEVPPDDVRDARLKQPNVVGVLTYASEDRVIREALLTCDNSGRAAQFRSFADETRELSMVETAAAGTAAAKKPREPSRTLKLSFGESYPSPPNTAEVQIPLQGDDLDLAHAHLPAGMHATAWRR